MWECAAVRDSRAGGGRISVIGRGAGVGVDLPLEVAVLVAIGKLVGRLAG